MVIFTELRLNDKKDVLSVECYLENLAMYKNMYIDEVLLYHYSNASEIDGLPIDPSKVVEVYSNKDSDASVKAVSLRVADGELVGKNLGAEHFNKELFFVMVSCGGDFDYEASYAEGSDNPKDVALILDWDILYKAGIQYVAYLNHCRSLGNYPSGYEAFTVLWFALKFAMEVKDYTQVLLTWKRFLRFVGLSSTKETRKNDDFCIDFSNAFGK